MRRITIWRRPRFRLLFGHPGIEILEAVAWGESEPWRARRVMRHVCACLSCRRRLVWVRRLPARLEGLRDRCRGTSSARSRSAGHRASVSSSRCSHDESPIAAPRPRGSGAVEIRTSEGAPASAAPGAPGEVSRVPCTLPVDPISPGSPGGSHETAAPGIRRRNPALPPDRRRTRHSPRRRLSARGIRTRTGRSRSDGSPPRSRKQRADEVEVVGYGGGAGCRGGALLTLGFAAEWNRRAKAPTA